MLTVNETFDGRKFTTVITVIDSNEDKICITITCDIARYSLNEIVEYTVFNDNTTTMLQKKFQLTCDDSNIEALITEIPEQKILHWFEKTSQHRMKNMISNYSAAVDFYMEAVKKSSFDWDDFITSSYEITKKIARKSRNKYSVAVVKYSNN